MKKALTIIGAALVLGTSIKEVTVVPCSNTLEIRYYYHGKLVNKRQNRSGNSYYSNLRDSTFDVVKMKRFFADSIVFQIVSDKSTLKP